MNRLSRTEKSVLPNDQHLGELKEENIYKADQGITVTGTISYSLNEGETLIISKFAKKDTFALKANVIDFYTRGTFTATTSPELMEGESRLFNQKEEDKYRDFENFYEQIIKDRSERVIRMKNGIKFLFPIMLASFLFAAICSVVLVLMHVGKFQNIDPNILVLFIIAGIGWGITSLHAISKDIRRLS